MAMQSRKLRLPKLTQEGLEDKIPVTGQINKGVLRQKAEKLLKKRQSDHSAVNVISILGEVHFFMIILSLTKL